MAKRTVWSTRFSRLHGIKPGGGRPRSGWTAEPDGTSTATCPVCGDVRLIVRKQKMAREDTRRGAHKVRLVAYPPCHFAWRLRVSGPR
jgi:ribosomal protein S14